MKHIKNPQDIHAISATINRPFRREDMGTLPKGGKNLAYVEANAIIDRLNEAFTPLGWSYACGQFEKLQIGDKLNIAIYGELGIHFRYETEFGSETMTVVKGQWGSTVSKANDKGTMEFGDDLKVASTDALKKCATLVGISNYVSRGIKMPSESEPHPKELLDQLDAIRQANSWTGPHMKAVLSGLFHKTVLTLSDLSYDQLSAAVVLLAPPEIAS